MTTPIAYSIGHQKRFIQKVEGPGIGRYNTGNWSFLSKNKRASSAIMSKARKDCHDHSSSPGPGAYEVKTPLLQHSHHAIIIGKPKQAKNLNPGPGSYNTHQSEERVFRSNPRFSFSQASLARSHLKKLGPGPGDYKIESSSLEKKGPVFGTDKKFADIRPVTPGPGLYSNILLRRDAFRYSFSRQKKFDELSRQETAKAIVPGPGAYQTLSKKTIKGGKFFSTLRETPCSDTPGPGAYRVEYIKTNHTPAAVMGQSSRQTADHSKDIPGPADYDASAIQVYKEGGSFAVKFGKDSRQDKNKQQTPGVGLYNINPSQTDFRIGKSASVTRRAPTTDNKSGQDEKSTMKGNSRIRQRVNSTLAQSHRMLSSSNRPIDKENQKGWSFSHEKRLISSANGLPGPGQYKIRPSIGQYPGTQRDPHMQILYV